MSMMSKREWEEWKEWKRRCLGRKRQREAEEAESRRWTREHQESIYPALRVERIASETLEKFPWLDTPHTISATPDFSAPSCGWEADLSALLKEWEDYPDLTYIFEDDPEASRQIGMKNYRENAKQMKRVRLALECCEEEELSIGA